MALGTLYGLHKDGDNNIMPSEHDRWYASAVLRAQVAIIPTLAWLTESAIAQEVSTNGHFVREHEDSIFANTDGIADNRGLEFGDADTHHLARQGRIGLQSTRPWHLQPSEPAPALRHPAQQREQCILEPVRDDAGPIQCLWHCRTTLAPHGRPGG